MAQGDSYVPFGNRGGPFPHILPTTVGPSLPLSGVGSPESVVPGCPGQTYRDVTNDDLWLKMIGTQETGWRKVGIFASTTEAQQRVFFGSASDPNGVQSAVGAAVYFGANGSIWVMPQGTAGTTGWQLVVGGV